MTAVAPVREGYAFISTSAQDRLAFVASDRQCINPSQLRRLRLAYRPPMHVQPKNLVEGRAHGQDVVVEAHAEDTRLLYFSLIADLARVLVLGQLRKSC